MFTNPAGFPGGSCQLHPLIILFVSVESENGNIGECWLLSSDFDGFLMGTGELLIERLGRAARVPRMGTWWTVDGLMLALEWSWTVKLRI